MGAACCENMGEKRKIRGNRTNTENKSNTIWIDPNINNKENRLYIEELTSIDSKPKTFKKIEKAIDYLKNIKFEDIKIIISSSFYSWFVKSFKENIRNMYFAPKIIVFTSSKCKFYENNKGYEKFIEAFYKYRGVATELSEVKKFLKKKLEIFIEMKK